MLDTARETIGSLIGKLWAPAIARIAKARHARMFHPVGLTFAAIAEPVGTGLLRDVGETLAGRVLVRCSAALWKRPLERFEVLGIAMRFRGGRGPDLDAQPFIGDQDLLFATIISPFTMPFSPFSTNAHDFLANNYWAVAPFAALDRRIKLRLVPAGSGIGEGMRNHRLRADVKADRAAFTLEARPTLRTGWQPIARIRLTHEVRVDQEALRFDPFRTGAGIVPVGLVHAIRRAAYSASQDARQELR